MNLSISMDPNVWEGTRLTPLNPKSFLKYFLRRYNWIHRDIHIYIYIRTYIHTYIYMYRYRYGYRYICGYEIICGFPKMVLAKKHQHSPCHWSFARCLSFPYAFYPLYAAGSRRAGAIGTSPVEPPVKRSLKAVCNFNSATVYECLCWLVVWLPFFLFSHILGMSL